MWQTRFFCPAGANKNVPVDAGRCASLNSVYVDHYNTVRLHNATVEFEGRTDAGFTVNPYVAVGLLHDSIRQRRTCLSFSLPGSWQQKS